MLAPFVLQITRLPRRGIFPFWRFNPQTEIFKSAANPRPFQLSRDCAIER